MAWAINRRIENLVHNLKYWPRTRLLGGTYFNTNGIQLLTIYIGLNDTLQGNSSRRYKQRKLTDTFSPALTRLS